MYIDTMQHNSESICQNDETTHLAHSRFPIIYVFFYLNDNNTVQREEQ